jgi:hypothetical protein
LSLVSDRTTDEDGLLFIYIYIYIYIYVYIYIYGLLAGEFNGIPSRYSGTVALIQRPSPPASLTRPSLRVLSDPRLEWLADLSHRAIRVRSCQLSDPRLE